MKDASRKLVVYTIILMMGISISEAQVLFEESATSLGLTFTNNVFEGNGISFCDFNNDGWDDITVGGNPFDELFFYQNINGIFTLINVDI
ncbi:hypothetical protein [Patiriisocius sp. Uisw_017]|jgi:hypothetical protein|uniref:hypothetical protein n=1 Tax=Patiriisocius sp. Uisw_017 TaxID=3230968 RepID=UPI0039E9C002